MDNRNPAPLWPDQHFPPNGRGPEGDGDDPLEDYEQYFPDDDYVAFPVDLEAIQSDNEEKFYTPLFRC